MPEYPLACDKCDHQWEDFWKVSEFDEKLKKAKCPECKSKKVYRDFNADNTYMGYTYSLNDCKTIGQYAEKQRKKYGEEKSQLMEESFVTQKTLPDNDLGDGMKRIRDVSDMKGKNDR